MDLVLLDTIVLTMDRSNPRAAGIAVRNGRIAAVGPTDVIERLIAPATTVLRLPGKAVIPGFVDPHTHLAVSVLEPVSVDCSSPPHESIATILEAVAAAAFAAPPGRWIRGWGVRGRLLREGRPPTRAELDDVAPGNPVCLLDGSVHGAFVNSAALRLAGIDRLTPDPPHGAIVREADGEPTGALWETAADAVTSPSTTALLDALGDGVADLVEDAARRHLALGITSAGDALVTPQGAGVYRAADARRKLPFVVHQMLGGTTFFGAPRNVLRNDAPDGNVSDRLRGGTLKLFMDPIYPSAARIRFYPDGTEERFGARYYSQGEANELVLAAHRRGLQVAIHCLGTWSIEQALVAIRGALRALPREDPRFRIEHFTTPTLAQIHEARELGVIPVVQPPYMLTRSGGGNLAAELGGDVRLHPYRTMLDQGVAVAASSDYPCAPLNPLLGVRVLVTRRGRSGEIQGPEEAIGVADALRLYTLNAAVAMRREEEVGSIEPGKRADLVVLSADPTAVPPEAIGELSVDRTYVDGELAFARDAAPERRGTERTAERLAEHGQPR